MLITCPKCSAQYQIPEGVRLPNGKKMKCSNCQHIFVLSADELVNDSSDVSPEEPLPVDIDPVVDDKIVEEQIQEESVFAEDDVFKPEQEVPQPFIPVEPIETKEKSHVGIVAAIVSLIFLAILIGAGIMYRDAIKNWTMFGPAKKQQRQEEPVLIEEMQQKQPVAHIQKVDTYVEETPQTVVLPQIQSVRFEKNKDVDLEIRIEGVLANTTAYEMTLPKKVRAFAYDSQGQVLFEKEIYLTDKVLPAGATLSFFGTYQAAPEGVQWVDVTF